MNQINVTIELCAEDRARLDNILAALEKGAAPSIEKAGKGLKAAAESAKQAAATVAEPEPAKPEPEKPEPEKPAKAEPEKTEPVPEVSAAELQSKVVQLVGKGKKEEARAIIMEYAKSVSDIPADKRAEVLAKLNALEG